MRRLPTLLTLCLISGASHAADNGFYAGAGIGASDFITSGHHTASDVGYKVIGGFRLLDSLALEVNYLDFGKTDVVEPCSSGLCGHGDTVEPTAFSGFAVGFLHFPVLDVFAKLGVASVEAKANVSGTSVKGDTTDVAWGAGVQAHFGSLAVRGEYEQYKYKLEGAHEVRLLSISLLYTFL
jgi:hypothetical protein